MAYGDEFIDHIKTNNIVVYAIQDYGLHKTDGSRKIEPFVYALFDVNGHSKYGHYMNVQNGRSTFMESLAYFQSHRSYVTDYCYDSNKTGHLHVIVFKLPYPDKFNYFIKGLYSKMYSEKEIDQWIVKYIKKNKKDYKTDQYCVLSHDEEYFPVFKDIVKEEFGTILTDNDIGMEYDFPPQLNKEILRYDT